VCCRRNESYRSTHCMGCRADVRLPSSTDSHTRARARGELVFVTLYAVVPHRDRSLSCAVPSTPSHERSPDVDSVHLPQRKGSHGEGGIQRPESLHAKLRATSRRSTEPPASGALICGPRRSADRELNAAPRPLRFSFGQRTADLAKTLMFLSLRCAVR
jgi:hypothetical protein